MSCFTTEDERPDVWTKEDREKKPIGGPITATRGLWIRKLNSGDYELYYDGNFLASWGGFNEHVAAGMMEHVYDFAFKEGMKKNQADLRKALGLLP